MRRKNIDNFNNILSLIFIFVITYSLFVAPNLFSSTGKNLMSFAQELNLTNNDDLNVAVNYTALSLIPLMIEEMKNTNATSIPIEQVINATPSNVTAIQNMSKNSTLGNNTNNVNNFNSANETKDLIPVVVNLTKNTNATDVALERTINATPSNVTAIQNMSKNSTLGNNTNNVNNFSSANETKDLIPVVVNLTKNTNATSIPIEQVINATPSNVTAIQSISKNSTLDNNTDNNFGSVNKTKDL